MLVAMPVWADSLLFYSVIDLGPTNGTTLVTSINNLGQIVGSGAISTSDTHAYITGPNPPGGPYQPLATSTDLGTLGGPFSEGLGVNNSGQVVGDSYTSTLDTHAFVSSGSGSLTDLGTLGGTFSQAFGINASGTVVGAASLSDESTHAFVISSGGGMIDLGTLGGTASQANAINSAGQITGSAMLACNGCDSPVFHAFLTASGSVIDSSNDLGSLAGPSGNSYGIAVNSSGQVAGYSDTLTGYPHAFLTSASGAMADLGTLGGASSQASGLNDSGLVVGFSFDASGNQLAFLSDGTTMFDLNALIGIEAAHWVLVDATAINNLGQIVGTGLLDGVEHVFLLEPTATPEPGGWFLMAGGLGLLAWWRKRGRTRP